jgi:hypothetical protein
MAQQLTVGDVLQCPCEHRHHHMTVNEYLNSFIQLSRYAPDDISTDEKKQDVFLNGLNDDI